MLNADLEAVTRRYPGNYVMPPHSHPYAELILVLAGTFTERSGGKILSRTIGSVQIMPANEMHENHYGSAGAECFLVRCGGTLLERLQPRARALTTPQQFDRGTSVAVFTTRLFREFVDFGSATSLAFEGLLLQALSAAERELPGSSPVPKWLREARRKIEVSHGRVRISDVAKSFEMHPHYFATAFRKAFGLSPKSFAINCRLQRASDLLADSRLSVSQVALESGFTDQAHFAREFRRHTGVTPTRFREARQH
jgi:AraC-like DNA-binding protein